MKFKIGDKVDKVKGYKFPSVIVAAFVTTNGDERYVAEMDGYGLLHIFNGEQLESTQSIKSTLCNHFGFPCHCEVVRITREYLKKVDN